MYGFEAHYINMDNGNKRTESIEVEGQFFDSERAIYMYAMGIAYDHMKPNESFDSLEFIYC